MTDTFEECINQKHSRKKHHGKKNLKSKFTSGLRNIFHHSKPVRRAVSMPTAMHLMGDATTANHLNEPLQNGSQLPSQRSSVDVSITVPETEYRETARSYDGRPGVRPVSMMCFGPSGSPDSGTESSSLSNGGGLMMNHLMPYTPKQNKKLDDYHRNETVRVGSGRRPKSRLNTSATSLYEPRKKGELDVNNNNAVPSKKLSTAEIESFHQEISKSLLALDRLALRDNNGTIDSGVDVSIDNSFIKDEKDSNTKFTNELTSLRLANNTTTDGEKMEEIPLQHGQQHNGTSNSSSSSNNSSRNDVSSLRLTSGYSTDEIASETKWQDETSPVASQTPSTKQTTIPQTLPQPPKIVTKDTTPISTPSSTPKTSVGQPEQPIPRRNTVNERKPRERPVTRSSSTAAHTRMLSSRSSDGMVGVVDKSILKTVVSDVINLILSDKKYDDKLVTRWCKDICVKVRDRLLRVHELRHKVVVNTHIAGKVRTQDGGDSIHVATRCEADATNDRFVTVALEGEDLYVWVTVLLLQY